MSLPQDPFMLASVLNTYLRDFYQSLDELCQDRELNKDKICEKLGGVGFNYDSQQNQFHR